VPRSRRRPKAADQHFHPFRACPPGRVSH
jgi:hypothetical protein